MGNKPITSLTLSKQHAANDGTLRTTHLTIYDMNSVNTTLYQETEGTRNEQPFACTC